jgi:tetratricopeptide (TPR) repeat protein
VFGGWYFNAAGLARASQLVAGLSSQAGPQSNLAQFKAALQNTAFPGNQLGLQEANEQLAQFTSTNVVSSSIDPALKQDYIGTSLSGLQQLMAQRKDDARLELFAGTLLAQAGAYQQALQYLGQAAAHSPQKQQILFELGLVQIQSGDNQSAIATMKKAFDEEPAYDTARVMLAAAYYYAGQGTQGDQVLIDKWGTTIVDNAQLLQTYMNLKLYARAEAVWRLRIQGDPHNVQPYLGLASVYFQAGDNANTIATLKEAEAASPKDAAQLESIIAQIKDGTLKPGAAQG